MAAKKTTRYLSTISTAILVCSLSFAQSAIPNKPEVRKAPQKNFWLVAGIDAASTFADAHATNGAQDRGCVEATPFFGGEHPSPGRVYGTMFGIMAAEQTVSYFLRRSGHHKLWLIPMLTNSGMHLEGAVHSATCR